MSDPLFVYGTLLPGHAPQEMRSVCERLKYMGPARLAGQLFDLGPYPAAIIASEGCIQGELVEIDSDQTWRALDDYEGCPRPGEGEGLFRRVRAIATLASGRTVDCWIYVYNRDLSGAKLVECGCWRTHRGSLPG
jgi:gamma-glutamylcyclotransferase (GGCT)/AIG2-like uncharacterized protein YtfP